MKNKFITSSILFLSLIGSVCAKDMVTLIKQNQKNALPKFPSADIKEFSTLQKAAYEGDVAAQKKWPAMMVSHMQNVYKPLSKNGGILFSVRRLNHNYDVAYNNYAVNIENFFEETTGQVQIQKRNFTVTATNGTVYEVRFPTYRTADASVKMIKDGQTVWTALSDLTAADQRLLENIFQDEVFNSSNEFIVSSEDSLSDGASYEKEKVSGLHDITGEKVEGAFASAATEKVSRKIVLENKSGFPLENLVVECQSFIEQTVMKMPKDFPSDYRCADFFEVKSLAPGERKKLELTLPETVEARAETIHTGDYEYYMEIPSDCNQRSEGRIRGVWVKVHRFTPYGEKLTREYKSSGVPPGDWINVAPSEADIR